MISLSLSIYIYITICICIYIYIYPGQDPLRHLWRGAFLVHRR